MKSSFKTLGNLMWITQLGFSVAAPLLLCIIGSVWLSRHFGIGKWIVVVGVFLGLGGAVSGLCSSLKAMQRSADSEDKEKPTYFNDHK